MTEYPLKNSKSVHPGWRWHYFAPREVLSPHGIKYLKRGNLKLQGILLDALDVYRSELGVPLYCNHENLVFRGWRSQKENRTVEKVTDSPHIQGIAVDLSCYQMNLFDFLIKAIRFKHWRGIGIYPHKNFIHHDIRTVLRDIIIVWNGYKNKTVILDKRAWAGSDESLAFLLKKELELPSNWELTND